MLKANKNFGLRRVTLIKQPRVPALVDADARLGVKDGKLLLKPPQPPQPTARERA